VNAAPLSELDAALPGLARKIRVLDALAWPDGVEEVLLRIAIRDNRPELVGHLFAGRLSLGDTVRLAPLFESGWLQGPVHVPDWAADLRRLAANLAFSAFIARIQLDVLDLEVLMDFADAHEADASA
jgi:hypothetical protein